MHSTISAGLVDGGMAVNIVPKDCIFTFEFRNLIEVDQQSINDRIVDHAKEVLQPAMRQVDPSCVIDFLGKLRLRGPFDRCGHPLVTRLKSTVGSNGHARVAFGTEAGLFSEISAFRPSSVVLASSTSRMDRTSLSSKRSSTHVMLLWHAY